MGHFIIEDKANMTLLWVGEAESEEHALRLMVQAYPVYADLVLAPADPASADSTGLDVRDHYDSGLCVAEVPTDMILATAEKYEWALGEARLRLKDRFDAANL
jgi:hypothetical protein